MVAAFVTTSELRVAAPDEESVETLVPPVIPSVPAMLVLPLAALTTSLSLLCVQETPDQEGSAKQTDAVRG